MNEELYIGGKWRPSSDGRRITVLDPATGEAIASVADGTVEDGLAAVDAAAAAQPDWAATAPRERGEVLRRAFTLMTERREDLARLIVRAHRRCETRLVYSRYNDAENETGNERENYSRGEGHSTKLPTPARSHKNDCSILQKVWRAKPFGPLAILSGRSKILSSCCESMGSQSLPTFVDFRVHAGIRNSTSARCATLWPSRESTTCGFRP